MMCEQRDELLADHAGRAENADGNRSHVDLSPAFLQKKADAVNTVSAGQLETEVGLAVEHNSSDTGGPLSPVALSRVGQLH